MHQLPLMKEALLVRPAHRYGSAVTWHGAARHKFTTGAVKLGTRYNALHDQLEGRLDTHIVPTDEVRGLKERKRGYSSEVGI